MLIPPIKIKNKSSLLNAFSVEDTCKGSEEIRQKKTIDGGARTC